MVAKIIVFVISFILFGGVVFGCGMFLIEKYFGDIGKKQASKTQDLLFIVVLVLTLIIGVSMGVFMASQVNPESNNPIELDYDPIYP